MHVQSCCFANLSLLLFRDRSRCLRCLRFKDLCFNLVPGSLFCPSHGTKDAGHGNETALNI